MNGLFIPKKYCYSRSEDIQRSNVLSNRLEIVFSFTEKKSFELILRQLIFKSLIYFQIKSNYI